MPDVELWTNALKEQWRNVRDIGDGLQPFFCAKESEVTPYIESLASRLRDVCIQNESFFRKAVFKTLENVAEKVSAIEAGMVTRSEAANLKADALPAEYAAEHCEREADALRRFRLVPEFKAREKAERLANRLTFGDLRLAPNEVRSSTLGLCIRTLSPEPTRSVAQQLLVEVGNLPRSPELEVAQALFSGPYGDTSVRKALVALNTNDSWSAAFIQQFNSTSPETALEWLTDAGHEFDKLDTHAKCAIIVNLMERGNWELAKRLGEQLTEIDFEFSPVAEDFFGLALTGTLSPEEHRSVLLFGVPFSADRYRLSDTGESLALRHRAIGLFGSASERYLQNGLRTRALETNKLGLWLSLLSTERNADATARLKALVLNPQQAIHFVNLGLRFGPAIDREQADKIIKRHVALEGELGRSGSEARLSWILLEDNADERANLLNSYVGKLRTHLDASVLNMMLVETLCVAGRISEAKRKAASIEELLDQQRAQLDRIIQQSESGDHFETHEAAFLESDSLEDLEMLLQSLEKSGDPLKRSEYALELFARTQSLSDAKRYLSALDDAKNVAELDEFLDRHVELSKQSHQIALRYAQSLYFRGRIQEALEYVSRLNEDHPNRTVRQLLISCLLECGQWERLGPLCEEAFEKREDLTSSELLEYAQIATYSRPSVVEPIVRHVANNAQTDATSLVACYHIASSSGWEGDAEVSSWLQQAVQLSDRDGPIKQISLDDLVRDAPDWHERQRELSEGLRTASYPLEIFGEASNRSICELTALRAARNRDAGDLRFKEPIPAFFGKERETLEELPECVLCDPTFLISLADLKLLDQFKQSFGSVVIPHGTLQKLFNNVREISFHQPSVVEKARNVISLVGIGALEAINEAVEVPPHLLTEAGLRTGRLLQIAASESPPEQGAILVVHPGLIKKSTSLGRETADLRGLENVVVGCLQLTNFLRDNGRLTQSEYQTASNFLKLQGDQNAEFDDRIKKGCTLLIDGLALSYLSDLNMLQPLSRSGLKLKILNAELQEAYSLVQFNEHADSAIECVERLRAFLEREITSGLVKIASRDVYETEYSSTSLLLNMVKQAHNYDAVCCDDRSINKLRQAGNDQGYVPVLSSLDILNYWSASSNQASYDKFETLNRMRKALYIFVPLRADEIVEALTHSTIRDGKISETAELRAIREYIEFVSMTDWLLIPDESNWVQSLHSAFFDAIRMLWDDQSSIEQAPARSSWVLELYDIRDWVRFRQFKSSELVQLRSTQLCFLAGLAFQVSDSTQQQFIDWFDQDVAEPTKLGDPLTYEAYLEASKKYYREFFRHLKEGVDA